MTDEESVPITAVSNLLAAMLIALTGTLEQTQLARIIHREPKSVVAIVV